MTPIRTALALVVALLVSAAPAYAQAPLGDGAWSWFGDPRAVHHEGRTYVGWVDHDGDIKVSSYDHDTRERVTAVLQARLNRDDHANPSILVRPDGRLMVFYSRHVGPAMHYRISTNPGDVSHWGEPRTVPTNVPGIRGYTYPNPIHLDAENETYLFWRGGNYNPTFSIQADGSDGWSPAQNLMVMPGERPYAKFAESGEDTIHVAYTNAHPGEHHDVNIYYARIQGGQVFEANGTPIGALGDPFDPEQGDPLPDLSVPTWVHDVAADSLGRPVIVYASFPSDDVHSYHYARWTGSAWDVEDFVLDAGGSFRGDGGSPYYSCGLTLDHEDPSQVYLSRQVGGLWRIDLWDVDTGVFSPYSVADEQPNVRPVSPRGMPNPFDEDLRVIWMAGAYPNYEEYETTIVGAWGGANQPPVADAEPSVRSGPAPLPVQFSSLAHDPDGSIDHWLWDFGDGSQTSDLPDANHTYTTPGRYFPRMTVTDDEGKPSIFVEEIVVGMPAAPVTYTGGASGSTVHGAVDPENQPSQWYFEYGPTAAYGAVTPAGVAGGGSLQQVSATLPGLVPGRVYHYRLVASNGSGSTEGADRLLVAGSAPGSDAYREAVLADGPAGYWRLGEHAGATSRHELGGPAGLFGGRFVLGQQGVLGPLGDTAASFDGLSGEIEVSSPALSTDGTLEGWFRWRSGTAVMRDSTETRGWLLAFEGEGTLRYRLGGSGYDTEIPIGQIRDGAWHHIVATKDDGLVRLYVDGGEVHEDDDAADTLSVGPWHVMRNGSRDVYSDGEADEIAVYTSALSAAEVKHHYDTGRALADVPPPPDTPDPVPDPPGPGTGPGGGVLDPGPQPRPAGRAFVRRGKLVVRGAPGRANRLTARKRGRTWRIADAAAPLRPGAGCKRVNARTVSCRARGVKRIELHGGAGADRLRVVGRIRALLVGGAGADRLSGGARTVFRGGAGRDRELRLP
jgi:BNR repeat-containing family member/Concanavalin A-like lectin/glucanases superfamily/PKD domain